MPLYEFICEHCQHVFEVLWKQKSIPDEVKCPKCGHRAKRKLSTFGFEIKI